MELSNFKAFERFSLTFGKKALLVGPNSAGKSTIISALRTTAEMLRYAGRKAPEFLAEDRGLERWAYRLDPGQFSMEEENLRHEFRELETRVECRFKDSLVLRMVWPQDRMDSYFYLGATDGWQPRRPADVKRRFPSMAVVPVLTPVEHREELLAPDYVRKNLGGRRSSRHFRNQVYLLGQKPHGDRGKLEAFLKFCRTWARELSIEAPSVRRGERRAELDVYYAEGHRPKEIVWAGDGMQVWLQILLHIFLAGEVDTLVLDEPDVFLHADLQRRLLALLGTLRSQSILATHSAEMLAEATADAVVWVDKTRRRAVRAPDAATLDDLSRSIGSQFNIRLARVLRARVALFVEGTDMAILRILARTVGANRLANEDGIAVVQMEGVENWRQLEGFGWIADELLLGAVRGYVILDRDFHSETASRELIKRLDHANLEAHVWQRHELESYLLAPAAIARVSGATTTSAEEWLTEATDELKHGVLGQFVATRHQEAKRGTSVSTVATPSSREFDKRWTNVSERLSFVPAKEVISALNRRLQQAGYIPS